MNTIKLSLYAAEQEFGCNRDTLRKRLIALEINGDADGCFTIQQICKGLFGDERETKLRKLTEEADALQRERLKDEGRSIDVDLMSKQLETKAAAFKQFILETIPGAELRDKILNGAADLFSVK